MKIIELECSKNANVEHVKRWGSYEFDFEKYPEGFRKEIEEFVLYRGTKVTVSSIKNEVTPFNELAGFLNKEYPSAEGFNSLPSEEAEKKLRKWLIKRGQPLYYTKENKAKKKEEKNSNPVIRYFRVIKDFYKEDKEYILHIKDLPITPKQNRTTRTYKLNFEKIPQKEIRKQVMTIMQKRLMEISVASINAEMTAINHFSKFLKENYPEIRSLFELDYEIMSDYRSFLTIEESYRKSKRRLFQGVERIIKESERIFKAPKSAMLISIDSEGWYEGGGLIEYYTISEIERIREAVLTVKNPQVKRFLYLMMVLGTRMDNLLLITQDCLKEKEGLRVLHIPGGKTGNDYDIPIDSKTERLVNNCIEWTNREYGSSPYVFADKKNPELPMTTGTVKYHFRKMVNENDLKDDHGAPLKAKTHNFRRSVGKFLADEGYDDVAIRDYLGHTGLTSVARYREISPGKETERIKKMLDAMEILVTEVYGGSLYDAEYYTY